MDPGKHHLGNGADVFCSITEIFREVPYDNNKTGKKSKTAEGHTVI